MTGTDCRRAPGVIDRLVRGRVTEDDRAHALTCASCGPVLARAVAFDDELRRTARRLVVEELPRGVLDPGLSLAADAPRPSRGFSPGFLAAAAAVAILLFATAVALDPGRSSPGRPSPGPSTGSSIGTNPEGPLNSTSQISSSATDLGYSCREGGALPTSGPSPGLAIREAAACSALDSAGPYVATLTVGVNAADEVVNVWITADIVGSDTPSSRDAIALAVVELSGISLADKGVSQAMADFVLGNLPRLEDGAPELTTEAGGARLRVERQDDGLYLVTLELTAPS